MRPELSFDEHRTTDYIIEQLSSFADFEIVRPTATGLVARLSGKKSSGTGGSGGSGASQPTIAFRADIDALPINEKTTCDFCSTHEGVMHACGHDAHTAILLGLAKMLAHEREQLRGTIVFIFQCGEETSPGGARDLVKSSVLDDVQMFFALHLMPGQRSGTIAIKWGVASANKDSFEIFVQGKGGHSSMPQQTIDPVLIACQIVVSLQSIVARNINPFSTGVVSVTSIQSGEGYAGIPDSAVLKGIIRTFDEETQKIIKDHLLCLVEHTAKAFGGDARLTFLDGDYRAIYNDESLCQVCEQLVQSSLGSDALIVNTQPESFSEDFSAYLEAAPGLMVWLGIDKPGEESHKLHSPFFNPNEKAFLSGLRFFYAIAKHYVF